MAIRSSLKFIFDGITSDSMGLVNVNVSNGMLDEPFLAPRHINEVKIRGRDKPYFSGITKDALQFTLSFAFQNTWDTNKIREIARWLSVDFYKPLQFSDNLERIYYSMPESDSHLIHNALSQGYITLNFRCDSPYSYSPKMISSLYDLSTNPNGGTTIIFNNLGDINIRPEIWIKKIGAGNVSIQNLNNGGQTFTFTGLADQEEVYVDNDNEIIQSDLIPTTYRFSNFNNKYLEMVYGTNNLLVTGNCTIQFRYEYIYLQG